MKKKKEPFTGAILRSGSKLGFWCIISPSGSLISPTPSVITSAVLVVKCLMYSGCARLGEKKRSVPASTAFPPSIPSTYRQLRKARRPFARMHLSYPRCRYMPSWARRGTTSGRGGPPPRPSGEPSEGPWTPQLESWWPWGGSDNLGSWSLGSTALNLCQALRSAHAAPGRQREDGGREGLGRIRERGSNGGHASTDGWRTRNGKKTMGEIKE